jgi:enoyl-CoA hydratase/carnithine racemase
VQFETLLYDEQDGVARVTLNRPEALNAFDPTMMTELQRCWRALRANDDVRAIVLTGAGERAFCTGIDRKAVLPGDLEEGSLLGNRGSTPYHSDETGDIIPPKTAGDLWKPIIAAVNGIACGGAFYLLAESDIIISADTATYFDPHTTYGMAAVFEPIMLLQRMPLGEVLRLSLLGAHERMSAARAHQIGLVSEVVPGTDLLATAHDVAARIASQPARAVQATLRAIWYGQEVGYRQALDLGRSLIQLGNDDATMAEGNKLFESGTRIDWRSR